MDKKRNLTFVSAFAVSVILLVGIFYGESLLWGVPRNSIQTDMGSKVLISLLVFVAAGILIFLVGRPLPSEGHIFVTPMDRISKALVVTLGVLMMLQFVFVLVMWVWQFVFLVFLAWLIMRYG